MIDDRDFSLKLPNKNNLNIASKIIWLSRPK